MQNLLDILLSFLRSYHSINIHTVGGRGLELKVRKKLNCRQKYSDIYSTEMWTIRHNSYTYFTELNVP